ncbi:MAG: ribonuclease III [Coriobacteriia bacterium]|nr:ribonuclease III [Coriobacteriia bacterium]
MKEPASGKPALAEGILGHSFADRELLVRALTHPSATADTTGESFERLEFLGDALLAAIIAEELYHRFPDLTEGGLTRIRVSLVSGSTLSEAARQCGLGDAIFYGDSELKSGGRGVASALEDVYEAVTAALYLDAGRQAAREWVMRTLGPLISADAASAPENPKSLLQELVQAKGAIPAYRIVGQSGPPHDREFTAVVEIEGAVVGQGQGRSKREAEAAAAAEALLDRSTQRNP